jgi:hypothetical protein
MKRVISTVFVVFSFCLTLSLANATNLPPGGSVTPAPGSGFSGSPVGSVSDPVTWFIGSTIEGNVKFVEGVLVDPTTHDLDFFYQIQNNSPVPTAQVGLASTIVNNASLTPVQTTVLLTGFTPGITLNVFDVSSAAPFTGGLFAAPTASSNIPTVANPIPGDVTVTYNQAISPGQNSAILLIQTDATNFGVGGAQFHWKQNPSLHGATSGTAFMSENINVKALVPLATPEPGAYGLLSLAIAGLFFILHQRSGKAKAKIS